MILNKEKMEQKDFIVCLDLLVGAYPNNFVINDKMIEVWYMFLGKLENKDLWNVIYEYIQTNKYPPSISDLLEIAKQRGYIDE